jgi:DNA-directed RNA polymerase specialized sigma subunit
MGTSEAFLNLCNYEDIRCLKYLYSIYSSLENKGQAGDQIYLDVFIDLQLALENTKLTERQRVVVEKCLIDNIPQEHLADFLGLHKSRITHLVTASLKKLSKTLTGGKMYNISNIKVVK